MPQANRIVESRRDKRDFRALASLIVYHKAAPDSEPRTFVCKVCHHTNELCTCRERSEKR